MSDMNYLYTIGGYATLIGVGYALYRVSSQRSNRRGTASASRSVKMPQQEARKEDRKKKQRLETFALEAQEASKAKGKADRLATEEPLFQKGAVREDVGEEEADNREFARQLAKAKQGASFAPGSEGTKQREKSVKQSRANQVAGDFTETKPPAPSSAAAGKDDARRDQTPPLSPIGTSAADAAGVSDVLEGAPAGPSVLRVIEAEPSKQKPRVAESPEKVETKKQRQNRKKAEASKAAREEAERDRKVLEERQRRAARVAEGRAAKDGSQFMAAGAATSAWNRASSNGVSSINEASSEATPFQLLDTLETPSRSREKPVSEPKTTDSSWMSSLPSEEEQMAMLKGEADDWSTVKVKSSKKLPKKPASVSSSDEKPPARAMAADARPPAGRTQQLPKLQKSAGTSPPAHFGGSFSALTTKDDEVEEEWDV